MMRTYSPIGFMQDNWNKGNHAVVGTRMSIIYGWIRRIKWIWMYR